MEQSTLTQSQAKQLAAYLPVSLVQQILHEGLPPPGEAQQIQAAALFSDISGFTAMSEELAADGPRGAEELNQVLLTTFTAMIDVIHALGGAVSHFYGDAMSIYFPDSDGLAAHRALVCAQQMQRLMLSRLGRVITSRPLAKDPIFDLTIKIGVGYGDCEELLVGDPQANLEFVLRGPAVDEAAAAEKQAKSGQVIASRRVLNQAGLPAAAPFNNLPDTTNIEEIEPKPILNWAGAAEAGWQRLTAVVPAFAHQAIIQRLLAGSFHNLGEHRPVSSLFVQFKFDDKVAAGSAQTPAGVRLQRYYQWAGELVARFGRKNARVNRILTGDKGNQLHIIFGAPVAPDAPEQSIRCALALMKEKPAYVAEQRIGLVVGKVFAGPVGSVTRQEYTVVGDVVNLSARLMQVCAAGELLTEPQTAARTEQLIEYETLTPIYLKGKQAVITPKRPLTEKRVSMQMHSFVNRWPRPLVGCQSKQTKLYAEMDKALSGNGVSVALGGGTGTGKSHILADATRYWLDAGGSGYLGVCYPHTAEMPYSVWRPIWQAFFGLNPGMTVAEQMTAVAHKTKELLPDQAADTGLWAEILGLPLPQAPGIQSLTAEARQIRLWRLARHCLLQTAQEKPVCLLIEDLHWADQVSLALLAELVNHLNEQPVFVAFTYRTDTDRRLEILNHSGCVQIMMSDLNPQAARELLSQMIGIERLPLAVEMHLGLRDRDGRDSPVNPLFLEEAIRMMEGSGVLQIGAKVQVNERLLARVQVPDTIHGLLLARLDRLPVSERDLLQVASVIGRQFAVEPLTVISSETSLGLILNMLADLSELEMTRLVESDPAWIYLFRHAMTHEVAYESLPYVRRQLLHALIADWLLETNVDNLKPHYAILAYHFKHAGNDRKGLEFAQLAADDARHIFANQEAVDLYTQAENHLIALGILENRDTAVALYLSRANVYMALGNLDAAFADTEKALTIAVETNAEGQNVEANNLLAEIYYRQGRLAEMEAITRHILEDLATVATPEQRVKATIWASWAAASKFNYDLALRSLDEAEALCVSINDNFLLARVLEAKSYAYYLQKELENSLLAMQQGVALSREFSTPLNLGTALNNIGFVQFMLGRNEAAVSTYAEAIAIGYESGQNLLAIALANRGAALSRMGAFPEALQDFKEADELLAEMNYPSLAMETYLFWGFEYHMALRQWRQAGRFFKKAQEIIDQQPEAFVEENARVLIGLGCVELSQKEYDKALALLEASAAQIKQKKLIWWAPVVNYHLAEIHLQIDDEPLAQAYLEKAMDAVAAGGMPEYKSLILLQLGKLATGKDVQLVYYQECIQAAISRARFVDKVTCFLGAGPVLIIQKDPVSQELGRICQDFLASLESV